MVDIECYNFGINFYVLIIQSSAAHAYSASLINYQLRYCDIIHTCIVGYKKNGDSSCSLAALLKHLWLSTHKSTVQFINRAYEIKVQ